jgi:hypothetical protein
MNLSFSSTFTAKTLVGVTIVFRGTYVRSNDRMFPPAMQSMQLLKHGIWFVFEMPENSRFSSNYLVFLVTKLLEYIGNFSFLLMFGVKSKILISNKL